MKRYFLRFPLLRDLRLGLLLALVHKARVKIAPCSESRLLALFLNETRLVWVLGCDAHCRRMLLGTWECRLR